MKHFLLNLAARIDDFTELTGKLVSWLVIVLVFLVGYDVAMRYLFQSGSIALQELQWHLFSVIFLLGAAYTLKDDEHVRLDLVYRSHFISDRMRAWIDALGVILFLLPFCILIMYCAWPFVKQAYLFNEASPDPGGLSARWFIKAMIPVGFTLLVLQGIAEFIKKIGLALKANP